MHVFSDYKTSQDGAVDAKPAHAQAYLTGVSLYLGLQQACTVKYMCPCLNYSDSRGGFFDMVMIPGRLIDISCVDLTL